MVISGCVYCVSFMFGVTVHITVTESISFCNTVFGVVSRFTEYHCLGDACMMIRFVNNLLFHVLFVTFFSILNKSSVFLWVCIRLAVCFSVCKSMRQRS